MLLITAIWLYVLQPFHILGFGGNQYINFYSCGFSDIIILKKCLNCRREIPFWNFSSSMLKEDLYILALNVGHAKSNGTIQDNKFYNIFSFTHVLLLLKGILLTCSNTVAVSIYSNG